MTEQKFQYSKIYKIVSKNFDKYYIGSTCKSINDRLYQHLANYKNYKNGKYNNVSVFQVLEKGDYEIILIEELNCNNKQELLKREGEIIKQNKEFIVNKLVAGRDAKQYIIDNYEKIKQYLDKNRQKLNERARTKYNCECGGCYTYARKAGHFRTKLHTDFINNIQQNINNTIC
jgi:hypothetical protein